MADILRAKGNDAFKSQEYAEAERIYTAAIQLDPSDAVLYSNRAMALIKMKSWETCLQVCQEGLDHNPDPKTKTKLIWRLGIAQFNLKDYPSARGSYQKALETDPKNPMVLKSLEELTTAESKTKRSHSIDEKVQEKRAKTLEVISIYEVDCLPPEFTEEQSIPSTALTSSPTPQPSTKQATAPAGPKLDLPSSHQETLTLHQFTTIVKSPSPETYIYAHALPKETYARLFGTGCIEPAVLNFVLDSSLYLLGQGPSTDVAQRTLDLMQVLSEVPRFSFVHMFCDKTKLQNLKAMMDRVKGLDQGSMDVVFQAWN